MNGTRFAISAAMRKLHFAFVIAIAATLASSASAQSISRRWDGFPGKDELTAEMGLQASLGGTTPAGFKLFFDYAHRLNHVVWLDFKVSPTFDTGYRGGTCIDQFGNVYACGGDGLDGNGYAIDLLAGVKMKWLVARYRLLPYCNINGGVVPVFARPNGDDGAAIVVNTGGGLKYFVHPRIGVGAEMSVTLGPGFYSGPNNTGHNELYRAFNFGVGAEFIL
jgi:hypothetical protein